MYEWYAALAYSHFHRYSNETIFDQLCFENNRIVMVVCQLEASKKWIKVKKESLSKVLNSMNKRTRIGQELVS